MILEPHIGPGAVAWAKGWTKSLWADNKAALECLEEERQAA